MATIKITDQLGLDEDVTLANSSALLTYFKQLPSLRLDNLDLAKLGGLTLDQPALTMLSSGVSFSEPVPIGAASPEFLIQAGAHGTFALFKSGPGVRGLSDVLAADIEIPQNECYVSLGMDASVGVTVQAAVDALTFGVNPGATATIVNYRLFPLNQGVTLIDALRETVGSYLIPASTDDLAALAPGSVIAVTGTGTLTLRVTANLLAITNSLASVTLPAPLTSASVSAGGAVSIGAAYQVAGSYQVGAQKLANGKVRVGWYREQSSQIQVSAAVSEGLSAGLGSTDLFSTVVGIVSASPKADLQELAAAKLSDGELAGISGAIKASVQRKLELALTAQLSLKQSGDAIFLYEVDLAALTAESRQAIKQALRGDLSALHTSDLPGISCVQSVWGAAQTTGLTWHVNLLGILNVGSLATLTTSGKVLYEPATGALVIADRVAASRIQSEQVNFGADTQKLRHVMSESFLATVVYRGAEGATGGPSLKFSHSYFDLVNQTGRDEALLMLRTGVALGLLSGDEAEAPPNIQDFGRTMVHATTDYCDRLATGMFLDSNGDPFPRGYYEQMGRNAVQYLVNDAGVDAARLRPAVDDSLWAQMRDQGQPGFAILFPTLSAPLLGAITADYSTIVWWAGAMAETAQQLASIRQYFATTPTASAGDPKFDQLRSDLTDGLKQVAAHTTEQFGQPWGLLAMYEASSHRAGAAIAINGPQLVRMKERHLTPVGNPPNAIIAETHVDQRSVETSQEGGKMSDQSTGAPGRKAPEDYTGLSRAPIDSHLRAAEVNPAASLMRPGLQDFSSADILPWINNWLKTVGSARHPFEAYPDQGDRGKYDLTGLLAADGSLRIAVAGDWGTGTDVAQQVADSMVKNNPELTIHLGDVYYVGAGAEIQENCLGVNGTYQGVTWRHGSKGSFALNGNHEMFSGGSPYFDDFLPTLGIPSSQDKQQLRSYFCLESAAWRIVAIDTGYNSDTVSGDCTLEQPLLDWLKNIVDPVNNRKPTVLLSHHQWFSGFGDGEYPKPAQQIAEFFKNQQIVWLWGHEHRLAIFYPYLSPGNHFTCYARCIGHGGMPLEQASAAYPNQDSLQRVEYWDNPDLHPDRFHELSNGTLVGTNGYAEITIQGPNLSIEYLDADGSSVLKESFVPGGGAVWDGTLARKVVSDPQVLNLMIYE